MLIVAIGVDILFFIATSIVLFLYVSVSEHGISTTAHIVNVQQNLSNCQEQKFVLCKIISNDTNKTNLCFYKIK